MKDIDLIIVTESNPDGYTSGVGRAIKTQINLLGDELSSITQIYPYYPGVAGHDCLYLDSYALPLMPNYRVSKPARWNRSAIATIKKRLSGLAHPIIHLHGTHFACEIVFDLAKEMSIPIVLTLHTDDMWYIDARTPWILSPFRPFAKKYQAKRSLKIAKEASVITAPSYYFINKFKKDVGYEGKEIVSFPMIIVPDVKKDHVPITKEDYCRAYHIDPKKTLVGTIGRIAPEKNLTHLLRIIDELKKYQPISGKYHFLIIGGGDKGYVEELKSRARAYHIDDVITFTGPVKPADVYDILKFIPISILPSLSETQGLVAGEALMSGSLPLVPSGTALAESIPDAQGRFIADDPRSFNISVRRELIAETDRDWVSKLLYLIIRPDVRRRIVELSLPEAKKMNDQAIYIKKLLGFYEQALHAKSVAK